MNHKTALAVAISALAALPAFADTATSPSVTLYGVADVGLRFGDYGDGNRTQVESGQGFGSRIGVKGEQPVDSLGMKGIFQIEAGINVQQGSNTQGGLPWGRQAYAGLQSDSVGTFTFGRQYTPAFIVMDTVDAFDTGFGPSIANTEGNAGQFKSRTDNYVQYQSPSIYGFTGKLGYTSSIGGNTGQESSATTGAANNNRVGSGWLGSLEFATGPFYAGVAGQSVKLGGDGLNGSSSRYIVGGATYNFQVAKVFASGSSGKTTEYGTTLSNNSGWGLGVSVAAGTNNTVLAQYSHYSDKLNNNNNCGLFGIGDEYQAAKSLMLYAVAARVNNSNTGTCTPAGAASNDLSSQPGFAARNLMLGLVYRF